MNYFMVLFRKLSLCPKIILILIITCITATSLSGVDDIDPFPRELLNHKTFRVFRSENRLGYVFRDEKRQIFDDKYWEGLQTESKGEDRKIYYSRKQSGALKKRFPVINVIKFKKEFRDAVGFTVILKGLKIHELKKPFILPEFRNEPAVRVNRYIASVISAEKIIIQVSDDRGVKRSTDFLNIFGGDLNYSHRLNGAIAVQNAFIGYNLVRPAKRDIARKPRARSIIKMAIFKPEDQTGDKRLMWFSESLHHKLEVAFQRIPQFYIITKNRNNARYHLKGRLNKTGSQLIELNLVLIDSHRGNRIIDKHVETIKTVNLKHLQEYTVGLVEKFLMPFNIKIKGKEKENLRNAVISNINTKYLNMVRDGWYQINRGKFIEASIISKRIIKSNPDYIDAYDLLIWALKYQEGEDTLKEAIKYALIMERLAKRKNDRFLLSKAYEHIGIICMRQRKYDKAITYLKSTEQIRINQFGDRHPYTVRSYNSLALAYGELEQYDKAIYYYKKMLAVLEKMEGQNSLKLATGYYNIGGTYSYNKKYDLALDYLFKSLEIRKNRLGSDHPDMAFLYSLLGNTYYDIKNYRYAEKYYLMAHPIYKKEYGVSHPYTVDSYLSIAAVYKGLGDNVKYNQFMEKYKYYKNR